MPPIYLNMDSYVQNVKQIRQEGEHNMEESVMRIS